MALAEDQMAGTMKIEFAALAALPPQTLIQPSPGEAAGEAGNARTLVIFMGKDFSFTKFALIEMFIFIGILVVGYYYAWRKGAISCATGPPSSHQRPPEPG